MADVETLPTPVHDRQLAARQPLLGIVLRLAAMAMLGIMFGLVKLAGEHEVHVVESLFWRQAAGLPVVILWLWWSGNLHGIRTRRPGAHALRATLGLAAMALNFTAMLMLPMAEATTISFATPIFATVLAAFILREPTGRYRWSAVVLGFAGILFAMRPTNSAMHGIGPWVALAGALLTACVLIQLRRMSEAESAGAIVFWFSLITLLPLSMGMFFVGHNHNAQGWAIIAGLAATGAIAQLLLTSAMRHASVASIATMDYTGLIWSILFGFLIFDELPAQGTWLGAPIVIIAGMFIIWRERRIAQENLKNR